MITQSQNSDISTQSVYIKYFSAIWLTINWLGKTNSIPCKIVYRKKNI